MNQRKTSRSRLSHYRWICVTSRKTLLFILISVPGTQSQYSDIFSSFWAAPGSSIPTRACARGPSLGELLDQRVLIGQTAAITQCGGTWNFELRPESTRIQVTDQVFVCINYIKNSNWLLIVTRISRYLDLFVSSNHQNTHSGCCVRFPRLRNSFQMKLFQNLTCYWFKFLLPMPCPECMLCF